MSTFGNINDQKLWILNNDGTMNVNELGSGTKVTWNINDLTHGSIIDSGGNFNVNILPS